MQTSSLRLVLFLIVCHYNLFLLSAKSLRLVFGLHFVACLLFFIL